MIEYLDWFISLVQTQVFDVIHQSHVSFWGEHLFYFAIYIASLTILIKAKPTNGKKLFVSFSLFAMFVFCYNPFVRILLLKLPASGDAVYARIWMLIPVWLIIAFAGTTLTDKIKSSTLRNSIYLMIGVGIVFTGATSSEFYIDSMLIQKIDTDGYEIANKVLTINGDEPVGLLLFGSEQDQPDKFYYGGTAYYAIKQYSSKIDVVPIYLDKQTWDDYFLSDMLPDGETLSEDYLNSYLSNYRRNFDFSFVVMPKDDSLKYKMLYSGYQYVDSVDEYDIYVAIPRWSIQSYSYLMENGDKIYVISDNMGHFVIVGGGGQSDRKQLQRIINNCGNHIDLWIVSSPTAENIEGLNCIIKTEGFKVDSIYMPAINTDMLPVGFMDDQDCAAYEEFLSLASEGLFELTYVTEGDEYEFYGMNFQILSDMLDIQTGGITDNSMLFRMEAGSNSFLFCSYIGYEQGQIAIQKYGDSLESDFVQIASGAGNGLGMEFYDVVKPKIAFCDSIRDDAGRQTYDMLIDADVTCYCIEYENQNMVILE